MSEKEKKGIDAMTLVRRPRRLPSEVQAKEREYLVERQKRVTRDEIGDPHPLPEIPDSAPTRSAPADEKGTPALPPAERNPLGLDPDYPVGLALSGGGIRSATFSLGILQALAGHRIFRLADYLSTVSGGGYIGSCLTSLLTKSEKTDHLQRTVVKSNPSLEAPDYDTQKDFPFKDPDQIHHLRKHGNFLVARNGVFRRDSLRAIGTIIGAIAATVALFLTLLVMLAGGFVCFTAGVGDGEIWRVMRGDFAEEVGNHFRDYREGGQQQLVTIHTVEGMSEPAGSPNPNASPPTQTWTEIQSYQTRSKTGFDWEIAVLQFLPTWGWTWRFGVGGFVLALLVIFGFDRFGVRRIRDDRTDQGRPGELPSDRIERHLLAWFCGIFIVVLTSALFAVALLAKVQPERAEWLDALHDEVYAHNVILEGDDSAISGARIFLLASASFAGAMITIWLFWLGVARKHARRPFGDPAQAQSDNEKRTKDRRERSFIAAAHGLTLGLLILSTAVPALLLVTWWFKGFYLETGLVGLATLVTTRLLATVGRSERDAGGMGARIKSFALGLLLRLSAVLLLLAASVFVLSSLLRLMGPDPFSFGLAVAAVAFLMLASLFYFIDFNHVSLHYFYRDRLIETYLQTEADRNQGLHLVRSDENLMIRDLHRTRYKQPVDEAPKNPAPYHLLVTALNLPGSRDLARRDRKSDHFIFSRFYCGSQTTGYVPTPNYDDGQTLLARVMTISGAAASSLMGYHTFFSQAFAMTLFNIRLGYWMPNPLRYPGVVLADGFRTAHRPSTLWSRLQMWAISKFRRASPPPPPARIPSRRPFWLKYLFHELNASASARDPFVNLSDGGHTGDNIGLYPLLQRRCRLIIACDGECDSEYDFGSLASAIRQIFTDENVQVDIDLSDFEKDPATGKVGRHYAVGRIQYPSETNAYDRGDAGWLLYLKAAYVGDEGAPVRSYRRKCPEFPHQTTADQFFSDDQFEAYRSLGEQTARKIACLIKRSGTGECDYVDASEEFELEKQSITVEAITNWCEEEFNKAFSGKSPACGLQEPPGS